MVVEVQAAEAIRAQALLELGRGLGAELRVYTRAADESRGVSLYGLGDRGVRALVVRVDEVLLKGATEPPRRVNERPIDPGAVEKRDQIGCGHRRDRGLKRRVRREAWTELDVRVDDHGWLRAPTIATA